MSYSDDALVVKDVSKLYKIYDKPIDMVTEYFTKKDKYKEFWALKDIDFTIRRGEAVGIVGLNGAGKSTLLKIITGTLEASSGTVAVNGKISAILELGTGFNPQYTGRENIEMGCLCLGVSEDKLKETMDWIIDFSELEDVIDQAFYTYSSGMKSRLTFATAVSINPDIFIVDEALAAGDAFFSQKCMKRIQEICATGCTALFVSHSGAFVIQLCDRAIWLDKGKIREIGPSLEVVRAYEYQGLAHMNDQDDRETLVSVRDNVSQDAIEESNDSCALVQSSKDNKDKVKTVFRKGPYEITKVEILDKTNKDTRVFRFMESLKLRVHYELAPDASDESLANVGVACAIHRSSDFSLISCFNTNRHHSDTDIDTYHEVPYRKGKHRKGVVEATLPFLQITQGSFYLSLGILPNFNNQVDFYEYRHFFYEIAVLRNGYPETGAFYPMVSWEHLSESKTSIETEKKNIAEQHIEHI
jgi:lipopolysaccharide transport system ATP-binding protein